MLRTISQFLASLALAVAPVAAQHRTAHVPIGPNDSEGSLQLYLFDARKQTIVVIDQGRPALQSYPNLDAAMRAHMCIAGCNGGPFDSAGYPRGLVVADGKASHLAQPSKKFGAGVLSLEMGQLCLERTDPFLARKSAQPNQLIQTGPFLIEGGKAVAQLEDRSISRRTFVFTDGNHRWTIGTAPATTLHKLALALADPKTFKSFNIATALTLDGGLSSGFWINRKHGPLYLKESRKLRNFLGVVNR